MTFITLILNLYGVQWRSTYTWITCWKEDILFPLSVWHPCQKSFDQMWILSLIPLIWIPLWDKVPIMLLWFNVVLYPLTLGGMRRFCVSWTAVSIFQWVVTLPASGRVVVLVLCVCLLEAPLLSSARASHAWTEDSLQQGFLSIPFPRMVVSTGSVRCAALKSIILTYFLASLNLSLKYSSIVLT